MVGPREVGVELVVNSRTVDAGDEFGSTIDEGVSGAVDIPKMFIGVGVVGAVFVLAREEWIVTRIDTEAIGGTFESFGITECDASKAGEELAGGVGARLVIGGWFIW